ncbi:MAG: hypothetical protein R3E73_00065 [Porticoccaceae bacterium]|nr:hypothetical protein [Pseudomonadales bacterium]MCP5170852.1 hypothetical protein [Pseudomonadales bacterium]MCP5301908.1 hypothetical protein [Pseudomonadales bacterium]
MKKLYWRCLSAMGAGLSIGGVMAMLVLPVNVVPSLLAGVALGTIMAVSELSIDV